MNHLSSVRSIVAALAVLAGGALLPVDAHGQELTVSAAISLKEVLEEITPAFEAAHPGVTVSLNLGASGDLQRQIEGGAPVDIFVSAAARNMDMLARRGGIDTRTRRDVACNSLVVVVPAATTAAPSSLQSLTSLKRIASGNSKTVPAGQYAREALVSEGLWEELEPRFVFAENVRQALEYVARDEVDAGFVYRTDAQGMNDRVTIAFEVDPGAHQPIVYPAASVAGTRQRRLAREFVDFLASPATAAALANHGFILPPCTRSRGTR